MPDRPSSWPRLRKWLRAVSGFDALFALHEWTRTAVQQVLDPFFTERRFRPKKPPRGYHPEIERLETRELPAILTWDGGGADNNWTTAANWTSDTTPGSGDTAIFDGTSTKAATIDLNVTVDALQINSGYTNTITQGTGNTLTVGSGGFSQAAGTFAGGNSTLDINGDFALSGGTFTSTSGNLTLAGNLTVTNSPTFNTNSGTVIFDGANGVVADVNSNLTFNNLTFNKDEGYHVQVWSGDTLIVTGGTTFTNGQVLDSSGSTVEARGNVAVASTFDGGRCTAQIRRLGQSDLHLDGSHG
jgi:hypothetical protein